MSIAELPQTFHNPRCERFSQTDGRYGLLSEKGGRGRKGQRGVIQKKKHSSSTPSLVRDLKIPKLYPSSFNPTSHLTPLRQAILGQSDIFLPRVLTLMLVVMHLRGDLVRICEVRIVLQNYQEGLGLAKGAECL